MFQQAERSNDYDDWYRLGGVRAPDVALRADEIYSRGPSDPYRHVVDLVGAKHEPVEMAANAVSRNVDQNRGHDIDI